MPQLIIMHGVSGSGKSTQVLKEIKSLKNKVCSADHYFMNDGEYNFDYKGLRKAHAWCQAKAMLAMHQGMEQVIIDNTNMTREDWEIYEEFADSFGYRVMHVWMHGPTLTEDQVSLYAGRNKHGVTKEIIQFQIGKVKEEEWGKPKQS